MNRLGVVVVLGLMSVLWVAPAPGASVLFQPVGDTSVVAGDPVVADLVLDLELYGNFDFAYILFGLGSIGSGTGGDLGFVSDPLWLSSFESTDVTYDTGTTYDQEVLVDSFNSFPISLPTLAMGVLTISTAGMVPGDYTVWVDDGTSEVIWAGGEDTDPVSVTGSMGFTILPEPGALVLLVLGATALVRRRR